MNSIDEVLPDDLETSDRYVALPHKNDLDLGKDLVLGFVARELPNQYARVEGFFRRRGACRRFKEMLESEGVIERWFAFEAESQENALRDWCLENHFRLEI
jgi:hypothetical protein